MYLPTTIIRHAQHITATALLLVCCFSVCAPRTVFAEDLNPPPPAPAEAAEGGAPPPPAINPAAPVRLTKLIRAQYAAMVYPAYLAWLDSSNGLPDSVATFGFYLSLQALTPHQRTCFLYCYIESHRAP
jgi:hypothetical protein